MNHDIYSDVLSEQANPEPVYEIYTLIDITDTTVINPKHNQKKFHQAQNFNTFIQVLSLRTQILHYQVELLTGNYKKFGFKNMNGSGNIWKLSFQAEATDPWIHSEDSLYWLVYDFAGTPVHAGLNETIEIDPEIVNTIDKLPGKINTLFKKQLKA